MNYLEDNLTFGEIDPDSFPPLIIEKSTEPVVNVLKGKRIVDVEHVFKQFEILASRPKTCTMGRYKLQKENRNGLFTTWTFYCDNCEKEYNVTSTPTDEKHDVNDALAWGSMSIGIGFSQCEELFSILDVPIMSEKKFRSHETKVGKVSFFISLH